MATQHPSPTVGGHPPHHGHLPPHPQVNGHPGLQGPPTGPPPPPQQGGRKSGSEYLTQVNESTWCSLGSVSEGLGDQDGALACYERALTHNTWSVVALQGIACVLRAKDQFGPATEYLRKIIQVDSNNGEVWGSLGHCYLMLDDLQQAYTAYQQALYYLQDPKEPKLWYGIGILYDRYGSLEHAEEAFSQVMRMEPNFEKANEIYFRLGIIYKQQQKFTSSLECFKYIVQNPPRPLTEEDIWFQIGHVYEQQKDYDSAKAAYRRVLDRDPGHAKVLQQLGWLHHQQSTSFQSQEQAIEYLEKSVNSDQTDAQSWYLLGRCYMSQQKYPKAYEAYQQAVYRDGRNPTFWCSIGVLYYQINQYRDALDAYSRAIRLNPQISEVWYDLGTLYESCNNQTADALDAYQRAAELDPTNVHIKARLQLLQSGQPTSGMPNQNSAPMPQDVPPQAYQPASLNGPPGPQWGATAPSGAPPGPIPPSLSGSDWHRPTINPIRDPPPPPQHIGQPHEPRDPIRPGPPHHAVSHPASPRYESMRQYPDQRGPLPPPPGPGRRASPSPKPHHAAPSPYSQPNLPPQQMPPHPQQQGPAPPQPSRISNPNYGPLAPGGGSSSVPPQGNSIGPPPPPFRMPSPGPGGPPGHPPLAGPDVIIRPLSERPQSNTSPRGNFPDNRSYPAPTESKIAGNERGGPPPVAAETPSGAAKGTHEREDRNAGPPKRHRDWEDDNNPGMKTPSDEKRPRLDEGSHGPRPVSPPHRAPSAMRRNSPGPEQRRIDESRRAEEDQRRPNEVYQPSDAAHHPPTLPSMMTAPRPTPQPPSEPPKQETREVHEPAARKIDVDEDYDDDVEDEKRNTQAPLKSERNSPRSVGAANGLPHAQTPVDQKA